ncbi:MAG: DUF4296 domain-containing protein [Bacteroidales bacterium]|jgi:hypothetical protein|nr:DUF4296 domain-containing protein [Bacteroidales bacterium]
MTLRTLYLPPEKIENMFFYRYVAISIIMFLASCTGAIDNPGRRGLIPEKDLEPIIAEMQLADGLLTSPVIRDIVTRIDTVTTYRYIAKKYGYTKEDVDKTLHYYFLKNPKKLVAIYEKTLAKLSEMESILDKQIKIEDERKANAWYGERNYHYPVPATEAPDFEIPISGVDSYIMKFTATLFPDDKSVNAKATIFAIGADSALTGKKTSFETPQYIKDGAPHEYEIKISVNRYREMLLKGSFYDAANNVTAQQRHASIENIELRRLSPN